jgi:mannose-6-phosphate isomerase-like protein (cupin superfamily)
MMTVKSEQVAVEAGMLVFVPPATLHRILAVGDDSLIYVSATSPPFDPGDRWR